jgi:putative hemolysin
MKKKNQILITIVVLLVAIIIVGAVYFITQDSKENNDTTQYNGNSGDDGDNSGVPNPSAVYCKECGGTIEIREDPKGGQYGVCVFPDGSECDSWDLYRGDCKQGDYYP